MNMIIALFGLTVVARLVSLFKSKSNEKKLKKTNAVEYGKRNSALLVLFHFLYYTSSLVESITFDRTANIVTLVGVALFVFSMIILWIVIFNLKDIWTIKLIISPGQKVIRSSIFKYIRHPNYFLNIIPELIAVALICQAWYTLFIGLPLYLIPLTIRIVQEEKVMKMHFNDY